MDLLEQDDDFQAQCDRAEDPSCDCFSPVDLMRLIPQTNQWGCELCPGACPDGDFAKGGRPSHPALLPENAAGYAPGECGVHIMYVPTPDDNTVLGHVDIKIQDANTKELGTYQIKDGELHTPSTVVYNGLSSPLIYGGPPDAFTFGDQVTTIDTTRTIPGVPPCTLGERDERGIQNGDCGFHCP